MRCAASRWLLRGLLPIILCCASCTTGTRLPKKELYWPEPPPQAKIQWLETIENRHDAGIGKSLWDKVSDFITGKDDGGIARPYGVFVDNRGRIFIADTGQGIIHFLDPLEKRSGIITGEGTTRFTTPIGITGDGKNTLYFTDAATASVYRYRMEEKSLQLLYRPKSGRLTGIAFNPRTGHLYLADTTHHEILVIDQAGVLRFRFGTRGEGPGQFNFPTDLFFDSRDRLFVTDALNARIQVFRPDGGFLTTFGIPGDLPGEFSKPKGVAVDSRGNVFVCDALQDMVKVFDPEGRLLLEFGANGIQEGEFWMPAGIHIDNRDTIYVADTYNRRVQVFRALRWMADEPGVREDASLADEGGGSAGITLEKKP